MPESNLISRGQMVEKDGFVFVATTYGKMKVFARKTKSIMKEFDEPTPIASPNRPLRRKVTKELKVEQFGGQQTFVNKG